MRHHDRQSPPAPSSAALNGRRRARQVWSTLHGHKRESRRPPRGTWSHLAVYFGGQGVHREMESEGLAENHRVVINGSYPVDEPVGQRRGMVEPAL